MGLGQEAARNLTKAGNFGLSRSTWSNYGTAERMLHKCRKETKKKLELPLEQADVLTFVEWLIRVRKAKHGTISSYLAGLRQLHQLQGHQDTQIRTELVNLVLAGRRNQETLEKKRDHKKSRLPVTQNVMRLIKATLRESQLETGEKLLTWTVSCLAFNGAFRIHELLSREETRFDPRTTLLTEDINIVRDQMSGKEVIVVKLKWPKESRAGKEVDVEVFETGSEICPVKAIKKWWAYSGKGEKGLPAFRTENGKAWTGKKFNERLHQLLGKHFDYKTGSITSHSFRSGVTTTLGQAGFSDGDLKQVGRWSSRAFESYLKLPRTKRREMATAIGNL